LAELAYGIAANALSHGEAAPDHGRAVGTA
jgi:hypothetical protein